MLADSVSARIFTENTDPLDIFLQTRPFPGSLPFWTTTDRQQQQVLRVDTQPAAQAPPQRHTERTHHQIESALHARVQGLHALVQEIATWLAFFSPYFWKGAPRHKLDAVAFAEALCRNIWLTAGRSTLHAGVGSALADVTLVAFSFARTSQCNCQP